MLFTIYPMWFISYAASFGDFHVNAAWSAWGIAVTAVGSLAAYYVKKDSDRPSFVNNTVSNINIPKGKEKILPEEDESDPVKMPL